MSDDDGTWTKVGKNNKRNRHDSVNVGINFLRNRPTDFLTNTDDLSDNSGDEHEEMEILENPIFWNKFAFVGNITLAVQQILTQYQIFPRSPVMSLFECLKTIYKYISKRDFENDFEKTVERLNGQSIFISVLPRFTKREYGYGKHVYFIHIRFDWYFIADSSYCDYGKELLENFGEYLSFLGEKHTHIPISDNRDMVENMNNFYKVMKILKDKRTYDKFQPDYDSVTNETVEINDDSNSKIKPYYLPFVYEKEHSKQVIHKCKLFLEDAHSGYGEILDGDEKGKKIYLHNRNNCSKAFNGDIVNIMVFNKSDSKPRNKDTNKPYTGRVISVVSSEIRPVNKIFLCRLVSGSTYLMQPVCKTIPMISVDNMAAEKKIQENYNDLRKGLQDVVGIDNIIQKTVRPGESKYLANKAFITLKTLKYNLQTVVHKIYYVDCFRCEFIFLVLYRQWKDSYRFPFGEVVGLYTPDATFAKTLNLIKVFCDIPVVGIDEESLLQNEIRSIKMIKMNPPVVNADKGMAKVTKIYFSLKYPNKPYNEIAYSFEEKFDNLFIIGVHIVNLSDFINENDFLDTCARNRYFTLLLPNIRGQDKSQIEPDFLFSTAVTIEFLSLNKKSEVNVISFYFTIDSSNNIIDRFSLIDESIILNEEIDINKTDLLIKRNLPKYRFFMKTFEFCESLRHKRMKHIIPTCCFNLNYKWKINYTAFIIEEELKYLVDREADINHVYRPHFEQFQLDEWLSQVTENCNTKFSPVLSSIVRRMKPNFHNKKGFQLRLSKQFLENIINNREINIFKCESLFPDIGIYLKKWKSIYDTDITNSFIIDGSITLSITNPLSSYLDVCSQRIFLSNTKDDTGRIETIYTEYKTFEKLFKKYWTICKGYEIRHHFNDTSFILDCVFETSSDEKLFFHHPFLDDVNYKNSIHFESLNLNNVPAKKSDNDKFAIKCTWKTRIFIYNTPDIELKNYDPIILKDIYSYPSTIWRYSIVSSEIDSEDITEMRSILNTNKYTDRLTSEIILNIDTMMTYEYPIMDRQLMRIQFNYEYSDGIMEIVPEILVINPDFRVCLGHRNDPFKYFLHPEELSNLNYKRFEEIDEYKSQFIILNRLEGIHQTIKSDSSFTIHDLRIDWLAMKTSEQSDDIYGIVILEENWCKERFIKLIHDKMSIHDPVDALRIAIDKNKMEFLVCLQTFIEKKSVYWVGHGRVADICLIKSEHEGRIKNKEKNYKIHITLKLVHSNFPMKSSGNQLYSIELLETPISTRIFERSLKRIKKETFTGDIVMGKCSPQSLKPLYHVDYVLIAKDMLINCKLNEAQQMALDKSVNYTFSLIWGPPGTGKTMVGCIISYWYVHINSLKQESSSVLYCGPSNQSVDVVAEKLMKTFELKCPKLLRIFNKEVMNFDFPYAGARYKQGQRGCPDFLKDIALHHIIRQPGKPYSKSLTNMATDLKTNKQRNQMERMEFAKLLRRYEKQLKKAFLDEITTGHYEIVLTTAASSCKKLLDKIKFSQVILDECGMCSEPEAIGPILERDDLMNVVLIGDHKQLKPIITSPVAKGKQFDKSLFERLYKPRQQYCTMLDTQYRMHPSICEFPSIHFYKIQDLVLKTALCESWTGIPDSKLVDNPEFNGLQYVGLYPQYEKDLIKNDIQIADNIWNNQCLEGRKSDFKCYQRSIDHNGPIVLEKIKFINTIGTEINQEISCSTGSSQSKGNDLEIKTVESIYKMLINKIYSKSKASESILVITQYRLQENNLRKSCEKILIECKIEGSPRVSTVVKSQGSESDYVIFSTVRSLPNKEDIDKNPSPSWISKYLGFINDKNQFNVALTRAKKGLIIIGNSHLLSVDQTWKALIDDLKKRKCYSDGILSFL